MVGTDGIPMEADAPDGSDAAASLRRRHAQEIARLEERHERQLAAVRSSSRYQIGDALLSAIRSPRTIGRSLRQLRSVFTKRSRTAPALAPLVPVDSPNSSLVIGAVLDEFSWSCFANEASLVELRPDTAATEVEGLDLVLVESAWQGNRGQWSYLVNGASTLDPLKELVDACAAHDVPAVFWNKEDPVGFDAFIDAARLFPAVLTTDAGSVVRYRDLMGPSAVVDSLPFAAQPRTHNPMGRPSEPLGRVCFAGAWRGDKYPDRARQVDELMGPAHEMGVLDIYDRYADDPNRARLGFPAPYADDVLGSLSYERTVDAYRRYAAFLNVNSVTNSPTMFSRRVFEILACGTPVISTPSLGIDELLGDVVITADTANASRLAVEEMISDRRARITEASAGTGWCTRLTPIASAWPGCWRWRAWNPCRPSGRRSRLSACRAGPTDSRPSSTPSSSRRIRTDAWSSSATRTPTTSTRSTGRSPTSRQRSSCPNPWSERWAIASMPRSAASMRSTWPGSTKTTITARTTSAT